MLEQLAQLLGERKTLGLSRERHVVDSPSGAYLTVNGKPLLSFASNDYLGLANHPALLETAQTVLAETGIGSGASALISGHHRYHALLETALAEFLAYPRAILFANGYAANMGVISTLLGRHDALFSDKLNHASLNDGAILARTIWQRFAHNDVSSLEALLKKSRAKRKLIAVDAVFSMDGDLAPLSDYLALCERYDAYLYVDDAHGFGVLGEQGGGTLQHLGLTSPRIIYMATLGKAIGVSGAVVAAESTVIDTLVQSAHSYVYSTAPPPMLSAVILTALQLVREGKALRDALCQQRTALHKQLVAHTSFDLKPSITAIQPLMIGDVRRTCLISEHLKKNGIWVPAIRPPTVPIGTARLRISLSAHHTAQHIEQLVIALQEVEKRL